jgi:hypothetical protein
MKVQLELSSEYINIISEFLVIRKEQPNDYNKRLKKLKLDLSDIPYHNGFTDYLKYLPVPLKKKQIIYVGGYYMRVKTWYNYFVGDFDIRKPAPIIFEKRFSLTYKMNHVIEHFSFLYKIKKPLGYKFPKEIIEKGIKFKLTLIFIEKDIEIKLLPDEYYKKYCIQ